MRTRIFGVLSDRGADPSAKVLGVYMLLVGANLLAWAWALVTFRDHLVLLGPAVLAYALGLRHAVDADHIAAIDNVTRKLMQEGERPIAVGFFFSLGHSTVVVLVSAAIATATVDLGSGFERFEAVGGLIGTSVSALFLFIIGAANLCILLSVYRTFRRVRRAGEFIEDDFDELSAQGGLLGRLFKPMFRFVARSWHMYPLGFLFGLSFDTATEIGLLGISAVEASRGLPLSSIMVFPALFTAGMALVDTTDGVLMLGAYGWALAKPTRKLYYNVIITFISVLAALIVGGFEVTGLIADKLNLAGSFWIFVSNLNENSASLGYLIVAFFAATWVVSITIYRLRQYDKIDGTVTR
jgi:high-affinity nickel-transport protein